MARQKRAHRVPRKLMKPKYAKGTQLTQGQLNGYGSLANVGESVIDATGSQSTGAAVGSGALKGAAAGMALGPVGALIGGGLGAIGGGISSAINKKKEREAAEAEERANMLAFKASSSNVLANYDFTGTTNVLEKGGKIKSLSGYVNGGLLERISKDAVEVVAKEPGKTDSVELPGAFVDHNEIIDDQNRVFSDAHKTQDGKRTIAKEAKRLEKMKLNKGGDYDKFIDRKLDNLFNYQEQLNNMFINKNKSKKGLTGGGNLEDENLRNLTNREVREKLRGLDTSQQKEFYRSNLQVDNPITGEQSTYGELYDTLYAPSLSPEAHSFVQSQDRDQFLNKSFKSAKDKYLGGLDRDLSGQSNLTSLGIQEQDMPPIKTSSPVPTKLKQLTDHNVFKAGVTQGQEAKELQAFKNGGKIKPSYENGNPYDKGLGNTLEEAFLDAEENSFNNRSTEGIGSGPIINSSKKNNRGLDKLAKFAGTYGSNIANSLRRVPDAPNARIQRGVNLKRSNINDRLADIGRQGRVAGLNIDKNTAQAGTANSARAQLLASSLNAKNKLVGENNRLNASISNRETGINANIDARNLSQLSIADRDRVERENKIQSLSSANVANMSEKYQLSERDKRLTKLDELKLKILSKKYEDTGVADRSTKSLLDEYFKNI